MTGQIRRALVAIAAGCAIGGAGCAGSNAEKEPTGVEEAVRIDYGTHSDAFGELWLPMSSDELSAAPVVVLIHGGFWREGFFLDLMNPLIPSLLDQGYAVWNIEYRRVGAGGGYPATFDDVAAAVDHLASLDGDTGESADFNLDLGRVAVVGHSAGGHLAAWSGGRGSLPNGAVGADPEISPIVVVAQAGVLDLVGCAQQRVGGSACVDLVGAEPDVESERYDVTSPTEMVPFDAIVVAVHGEQDLIVPASQSVTFVERATGAGMDATHVAIPDADHFSNLDPLHPAWTAVIDALTRHL